MDRRSRVICFFIFCFLISNTMTVFAQRLYFNNQEGERGDSITFTLSLESNTNEVDAFGFDVEYNENILRFNTFEIGDLVMDFDFFNVINRGAGKLRVGGFTTNVPVMSDAAGVIVTLKFWVLVSEDSEILLKNLVDDFDGLITEKGFLINKQGKLEPEYKEDQNVYDDPQHNKLKTGSRKYMNRSYRPSVNIGMKFNGYVVIDDDGWETDKSGYRDFKDGLKSGLRIEEQNQPVNSSAGNQTIEESKETGRILQDSDVFQAYTEPSAKVHEQEIEGQAVPIQNKFSDTDTINTFPEPFENNQETVNKKMDVREKEYVEETKIYPVQEESYNELYLFIGIFLILCTIFFIIHVFIEIFGNYKYLGNIGKITGGGKYEEI